MRKAFWLVLVVLLLGVITWSITMPERSYSGPLPPLTDTETMVQANLERHVNMLAGTIGERNVWHYAALKAAADYIRSQFESMGYTVFEQPFTAEGKTVTNIEVVLGGAGHQAEEVVIGAHYDSVLGSPGANDNASGVAGLLEIARLLAAQEVPRVLRFVAFVNEEPPFFYTDAMGSRVYARKATERGARLAGMLSLETIGFYADEAGSQRYPFPFGFFYPNTGNFVGFVGNLTSRGLVHRVVGSFRRHTSFPSEATAAPGWLQGIGWSDHWSFWREGYPAVMVTDTALFRYHAYHTAADRPEILHYDRFARVVTGLARVALELAGGEITAIQR